MSTEERKSQLEFVAVDNTKAGFDSIKENFQGVADEARATADKTSSSMKKMADEAKKAADEMKGSFKDPLPDLPASVDRATASISASIKRVISDTQRQIATLKAEASGGGSADIFENLISQRGANADALKPLIGNLRTLRTELDSLRQAEQRGAVDINYERERAAAEQARRRADATAALTQAIEQQEAAERRLAGQNSFVQSLKAQSDAIGKTRADLLEMQAAQMGVSSQAAPYIARLREQEAALTQNGKVLNAYGQTAKQTSAALRQVPAQITDIVVSLQGGQAPLTVLLQQGGQLKDVFGGVAPALKGVAQGVLGLVNPYTLTAAALGAVALAYYQGSREADAYNKSIVLTGNAAGVTASQLQASAAAISKTVGTQGAAAATLAQLAETGQVAGNNLQRFAETSLRAQRDLGISTQQMAKDFEALGEKPVEASAKLTKQYGYLTLATFEQIKALQEQGKTQEAASLAQETYATAMDTKSARLRTQLGSIERAWQGVTSAAKSGWDAILNVGRAETSADRLSDLQRQLEQRLTTPLPVDNEAMRASREKGIAYLKEQIGLLQSDERMQKRAAEAEADRVRVQREGAAAFDAVAKAQDKGLTKQEQLNKALEEYRRQLTAIRAANPGSDALKPDAVAQGEKAIRDQFKEKGGGDTRGAESRQAELADLRAKIKAEEEYVVKLREEGIQAEKNTAGVKLADSIQEQLNGTLSKTTRAHLESKLELAKQLDVVTQAREEEVKRQKALEKSTEAMRKQIAAVYEEASATEQQRQKLDETTAAYGKTAVAVAQLAAERTKMRLAEAEGSDSFDPAYVENLRRLLVEQQKLVGSIKSSEYEKITRATQEQTLQAEEQNALIQQEIELIGLSEVERKKIVAARETELKLAKELREIEKLGLDEAQTDDLKEKKRAEYRVKAVNAANKVILDDWQKTADQINQSLTDALLRGFESGKSFADNLRDTLVNMFKTLVLRPIISAVISPISGAISTAVTGVLGGGSGGGSSVLGTASNAYSLYNTGSQIYTLGGQYAAGTMSGANVLGTAWANGTGAGLDGLLATNGAYGTAGGGAAAGGAGSAGIGSLGAFGIVAAVAALIGNAVGAFRSNKQVDSGLMGTLGEGDLSNYALWRRGGTLFKGPDYSVMNPARLIKDKEAELENMRASGGGASQASMILEEEIKQLKEMYSSIISSTKAQSDSIQAAYGLLRNNVGDMADVLGLSSDAVRKFTLTLGTDVINADTGERGLKLGGLSEAEISAKINEALATANNTLAEQVIGTWVAFTEDLSHTVETTTGTGDTWDHENRTFETVTETTSGMRYVASEYAREGEKAIDTLTRLATSLSTVNKIWDTLGFTMLEASLAGGDFASSLADAFGGLDAMVGKFDSYYQNFYTETERRDKMREQVRGKLDDLGVKDIDFDDPNARAEYRKAVDDAIARASQQDANRRAVSESLSKMDLGSLTTGMIDDALAGFGGKGDATPEALAGLAAAVKDLGASATGLDDFQKGVTAYIDANAEALGIEDDAAATAAALIDLSGSFAAVTQAAEDNSARLNEIADKRYDLEVRLLEAQGKSREALDMRRAKENAALMALDPALAKLAYQIWLLEDAAQAAADRLAAIDKNMTNLQQAYAREQKVLESQLDGLAQYRSYVERQQSAANESLGLITGVFDLLHDSIRDLYASVASTAQQQAQQGQQFIAQALSTALATGYLPDQEQLSEAIQAARNGIQSGVYANTADQDFAKLVLAGQLRALEEVTGKQKTDVEKQLEALDKQLEAVDDQTEAINKQIKLQQESLEYWQQQIDIANGVYDATLSVADAIRALAESLGIESELVNVKEPYLQGSKPSRPGGGASFGGGSSQPQAPAKYSRVIYGGTAGVGYEAIRDQSLIDRLDALSPVYHRFDGTGDLVGLAAAIKNAGGTIADLSILSGNYESDWRKAFEGVGIPAFAVGTNRVPQDMLARIHKDEAIIPKAFNPWANGGSLGGDNAALIAEIRALRALVAELLAAGEATAGATNATAAVLERVTNNGNAMVTEAAPI